MMQLIAYTYSRDQKNVSNLVLFRLVYVPFRNTVDLPFPLLSVSGALPRVGHFPRALATIVGFYEMEVLLVAA